jgi:hypothetical protein
MNNKSVCDEHKLTKIFLRESLLINLKHFMTE